MAEPIYHLYKDENLNKEKLMQSKSFINDAASFLMKRENYEPEDLETDEEVYDAYMEHFRVQNVNEATALRDLNYANRADDTDKKQFARLMDTYDRMDSDFGLKAMGDYLGGVFTAPSTYAGMFSFGAAKVGAVAANQGIKLGIKQALKTAGLKSAIASAGVEAVGAGTTVYAQEKTRVQTGIKEEVDPFAVGLATTLAATVGGGFGAFTGTQRAMSSNKAQFIVNANKEVKEQLIKKTFKEASEKVFTDNKTKQAATDFENELNLSIKVNELMDADSALSRGDAAAKAKEIIKKEIPAKKVAEQPIDKPYVRKTYTKDDIKNAVPNWFKEDPTVDVNIKVEDAGKTAIKGTERTYKKVEQLINTKGKKTLDYGAGRGIGAKQIGADTYEPFVDISPTYKVSKDIASESYDRITNLNVLNVVKPEARDEIVKEIGRILKPRGEAVISTRGLDIFGDKARPVKGVLGDEPMSVITSTGTYQKGFKPDELLEYTASILGNGYKVERVIDVGKAAVKITKKPQARLPLKETIPEALEKGAEVSKKLTTNIDQMEIKNIAAFASEIDEVIGDSVGILKGAERFTSRLVRALEGGVDSQRVLKSADLNRIMDKYGLDVSDLAPLLAHQVSEAASLMGKVSSLSKQGRKDAITIYDNLNRGLNTIDEALKESGMGTATLAPRRVLEKQYGQEFMSAFGRGVAHISKARVGLMTVQVATTVRNTTNGYMRNYIYAMDNLGTGASNLVKGGSKYLVNFADSPTVKEEADTAVRLGIAQLKSSFDAFMLKDLHLGMTNGNTQALFRLLGDVKGKNKDVVATLLRGMGDISKTTGEERGLLGLARTFNTLNTMSDNLFKRAVFSREIDKLIRANPKRYTTKKLGAFDETGAVTVKKVDEDVIINSLDDLLKKGRYDMLDPEDVSKAMNEAFEFTYQTGDFGMREGFSNAFFKQLVNFGSSPLGSTAIPFPRYLVNQFRFAYSHAPILGMINVGGILNGAGRKAGKKGILGTDIIDIDVSPEAFGRQLGGLSLLGALYAIRVNHGDENTGPYEYIDPVSGDVMDARAMLGPYTAFALVADVIYREFPDIHGNTKVSDVKPYKSREITEAVLGGLGRGGTGLWVVDSFVDSFQEEDSVKDYNIQKNIVKYLGNVSNTFFVGAGMLKDVAQQVDSSFLELPDNQDVDFFKYFLKQTFRSFPIAVDEDRPKLESPTRGSGIRAFNPIIKQFTGFTPREQRTVVENELSRLRFDYFETVPKSLKGDGPATNQMRGEMGRFMETDVFSYVNSDDYKNIDNDVLKRRNLKIVVNFYRAKARDHAINPDYAVTNRDFIDRQTNRYMDFSSSKRKEINEIYKDITQSERDIFKDGEMMMLPYLEELLNEQSPKLN